MNVNTDFPPFLEYNVDDPELPFDYSLGTPKLVLGAPSRYLIMRNMWFLSNYSGNDVVYLTAGTAQSIRYLVNRFRDRNFYIWNYCPGSRIKGIRGARVINGELDAEVAENFGRAHPNCLLIMDILAERLLDYTSTTITMASLERQIDIVKALSPEYACLRFRCCFKNDHAPPEKLSRYAVNELEYFAGSLYRFPWAKPGSPELALITDGSEMTIYDRDKIDAQMFYWNHKIRTGVYDNGLSIPARGLIQGYDKCWDCAAEIAIIRDYLRKKGEEGSNTKVKKEANSLNRLGPIKRKFHGKCPLLPVEDRRRELSSFHREI